MSRVPQRVATKRFSQGVQFELIEFVCILRFWMMLRIRCTIWQCVILVSFLGIGVRTNLRNNGMLSRDGRAMTETSRTYWYKLYAWIQQENNATTKTNTHSHLVYPKLHMLSFLITMI